MFVIFSNGSAVYVKPWNGACLQMLDEEDKIFVVDCEIIVTAPAECDDVATDDGLLPSIV